MAVKLCLMTKQLNLQPRTFADTKFFPGCAGNPFDKLLHSLEKFERMPSLVMNLLLIAFALLGGLPQIIATHRVPLMSGLLAIFYVLDWILIAFLPETKRSYGPVKLNTLMLAILRVPFAWLPFGWNLGFEIAGTLLVIYGFYIEPFRVDVHHETLQTSKLKPGESIRVLHLGDLHLERTTRREKWIIKKIKELAPDLILFSGDVLNLSCLDQPQSKADALDFFKHLSETPWLFGVAGSPAVDSPAFIAKIAAETPMHWLQNKIVTLNTPAGIINIIGVICSHNPDQDEKVLPTLLDENQSLRGGVNLLLYHSPDFAPNASLFDIDLQLSGHTHGGQVRLPLLGALYTGSLYGKTFEAGRYLVNNMPLYITRGLGMEGAIAPRVRFLCPPEMILWEIKG